MRLSAGLVACFGESVGCKPLLLPGMVKLLARLGALKPLLQDTRVDGMDEMRDVVCLH